MYKEHLEITELTETSAEDRQGNGKKYKQSITVYKKSSHKGCCLKQDSRTQMESLMLNKHHITKLRITVPALKKWNLKPVSQESPNPH